ncbi:MAG: LuxR C-terminal-related transcriptional regulator [Lysobacterales bacterium]
MNIQAGRFITGDPAFAVDRNGVVVLWNEASEQTFGYTGAQALGRKCWDLLCGQDINGNRYCFENCPLIEMAFRHEPVHAFHSSFETSSRQQKQFSVSCLTVYEHPGNEMLLHICQPGLSSPVEGAQPDTPGNAPDNLSQREIEVLHLLAGDVATQDIASTLAISTRTVRTHIQHLMYKLRVHNRQDAVLEGRRLNLL